MKYNGSLGATARSITFGPQEGSYSNIQKRDTLKRPQLTTQTPTKKHPSRAGHDLMTSMMCDVPVSHAIPSAVDDYALARANVYTLCLEVTPPRISGNPSIIAELTPNTQAVIQTPPLLQLAPAIALTMMGGDRAHDG
jgi:hypothetical protein